MLKKITHNTETLNDSFHNWQMIMKSIPSLRKGVETYRLENYIGDDVKIVENETEIPKQNKIK
jgi:hypothetical protein